MGWVISIDSSSRWEVKKRIVDRVDGLIRKNTDLIFFFILVLFLFFVCAQAKTRLVSTIF